MDARRRLLMLFSLVAIYTGATPAGASTITYNLTGDPSTLFDAYSPPGYGSTEEFFPIWETDTADFRVPGGTLSTSDTINANVTLTSPLVLPVGSAVQIALQPLPIGAAVAITESVSYYNNGVKLPPPEGLENIASMSGQFVLGQLWNEPVPPSFTFDAVTLSATVINLSEFGQSVRSLTLPDAPADVELIQLTPVPLPAASWLLLSGLGGLIVALTRRPSLGRIA